MDLVERYFALDARCAAHHRVGGLSAELRRLLVARIEAREAALQRPLNTEEAVFELTGFARRLLGESRAVMRRLEDACLGREGPTTDILKGGA